MSGPSTAPNAACASCAVDVPTYDYICSACGHEMEVVHGLHGHGPSHCPICGGTMRKSFAAPAVHFKGSGWAKKERGSGSRAGAGASAAPKGEPSSGPAASTGSTDSTSTTGTTGTSSGEAASSSAAGSSSGPTD